MRFLPCAVVSVVTLLWFIATVALFAGPVYATPTYQQTDTGAHHTIGDSCQHTPGEMTYSGANLGPGVDLPNVDLSCAQMFHADLSGANLSGANFTNAYLEFADMSNANLSGINLSSSPGGVSGFGTGLLEADLSNSNLTGANLNGAYLEATDFSNSVLISADLRVHPNHGGAPQMWGNWTGATYSLNAVDSGGNPIPDTLFPEGWDPAAHGMIAVPEPSTALLLGIGLTALGMRRRRVH